MTSKDDLAVLQQTMPTGVEGLRALEKFTRDGNAEARKLLNDECAVILECRFCRNIFRSPAQFVTHKRAFCTGSHVAVAVANPPMGSEEEASGQQPVYATKKRTGQMSALTKRLEMNLVPIGDTPEMLALYTLPRIMKEVPTTTFADGMQKIIGSLPSRLAQKESLPEDRVCVIMPQDHSSRYKEMSLRSRKAQNTDKPQHRQFASAEIKIIENFEKYEVRCADYVLLQCDHPSCAHFWPFHSLHALAYHCSLRHTTSFQTDDGSDRWPCLMCGRHMWSYDAVNTHMVRVHPDVKEQHLRKRQEEEKTGGKGGKKSTYNTSRRDRSLSPVPVAEKENNEEDESEEESSMVVVKEEEDEARGARRSGRRRGGGGGGPTPVPVLQQQPKTMDRRTRDPSDFSDDYGEPPVLHPADECGLEEEATEEDEEEVQPRHKKQQLQQKQKSTTTGSSLKLKTPKREKEEEYFTHSVKVKQEVVEEEEDAEIKRDPDSVERLLEDMLDKVCLGEKTGDSGENKEKSMSATASPPSREGSARKGRGRPKKADSEEKKVSAEKVKRQYIKKEPRDSSEQPSPSDAAAAAGGAETGSRPSRHRKRPRWMIDGQEMVGDSAKSSQNLDQSMPDESEEEKEEVKEEMKKKKAERPTQVVTPVKKKEKTPVSKAASSSSVICADRKMEPLLFTPRAGKGVLERRRAMEAESSGGSSKRKQNLGKLAGEDEILIVHENASLDGPKRSDMSSVPVYLSEQQQSIFFSGLQVKKNDAGTKNYYECTYCNVTTPSIRDGRRHMVAHLRVMRLRCGLCGAGAFFCIDMRNHLQLRGCPELAKAPKHMIRPGTPCMTKENADELTLVAHADSPGRSIFTSGKIVSMLSSVPYLPDPVIEEKILGPTRVPPRGVASPRKQQAAHKYGVMAAAAATAATEASVLYGEADNTGNQVSPAGRERADSGSSSTDDRSSMPPLDSQDDGHVSSFFGPRLFRAYSAASEAGAISSRPTPSSSQ